MSLICKIVYTDEDRLSPAPAPCVYEWAEKEYKRSKPANGSSKIKSSLVDESLKESPLFKFEDGLKITKLAMQCIKHNPHSRPSMKQVVCCLLNLHIVQYDKEAVGFDHKLFMEVTLPNPLKDKFRGNQEFFIGFFIFCTSGSSVDCFQSFLKRDVLLFYSFFFLGLMLLVLMSRVRKCGCTYAKL